MITTIRSTLKDFTTELNITSSHLSIKEKMINSCFGGNFFTFGNQVRKLEKLQNSTYSYITKETRKTDWSITPKIALIGAAMIFPEAVITKVALTTLAVGLPLLAQIALRKSIQIKQDQIEAILDNPVTYRALALQVIVSVLERLFPPSTPQAG